MIIEHYNNPDECVSFFKEKKQDFEPIKKITTYFDSENFLLTEYHTNRDITFVAENWKGEQLHLSGLNCGYGGTGPSATASVLVILGMSKELAEKLKHYSGLEIPFDEQGVIQDKKIIKDNFFGRQIEKHTAKLYLSDDTYVNFNQKKVYFINPQSSNLATPICSNISGFFHLLNVINPHEFQYYVGKNSPLDDGYSINSPKDTLNNMYKYKKHKNLTGINLIIRGEKLDILCLIDKTVAMSFIKTVYFYLFNESLFDDIDFSSDLTFLQKIKFLFLGDSTPKQGVFRIYNSNGKYTFLRR